MSDPVTNLDIEDVLSSIRRLVEDGDWQRQEAARLKAETAASATAEPVEEVEDAPERFVLTPSLRVTSRGTETAESADEDMTGAEVIEPQEAEPHVAEPVEAEVAPDQSDQDVAPVTEAQAIEPDLGESAETNYRDIDFSDIDWDADPISAGDDLPDPDEAAAQADVDADQAPAEVAETVTSRHRLMAAVVELEAAVGGQTDEWEPDGSEEDRPVWTSAPQETRFRQFPDEEERTAPPEPEVMFHHVGPDHVTEEQLSDLAEDLGGDMNPDMAPGGGHAFAGEMDEDLDAFVADSNVIDEDTLRRIVAEIVREELQGTLGERITRNVRKLVRREIYRALASQEFE